ncbi:eukaryotic translation initiation factor 3 subunit 8 [Theileria orientalis strain Shintoku]|uniref:Eukaryotic translation initiation factor 3 subunit C n=1 Tax=Theileria orientalis strain Shintoku TaxID=869250 RepID=J4CDV6_THEOR|nr:eukaryotic translation initiation factor 3 subunit 8 [Theileria orientalis strain Shintoku]PVC49656.1 eukaryotic translation initiation factor 3 subunit 8 [Theileria orientalis]BAM41807.1 eukaryotic translation initiation factor 3 subunit 8 [Theileria orientalis strain Shintoku]|eukprot:XP_009692108.1 eukaryotic translation initiation factor 3 subunit 8 [Theileria orientalis strain Shintoku]
MMQSRFWGDDSDDSYSDSSEYSSKSEEKDQKRADANKWAIESSDEDGESRVVRSAKAKALETIQNHLKTIEHLKKINDYSELLKDYDVLAKLVDKQYQTRMPKLVVKIVVELTQFMEAQQKDKESYKKLSKAKTISFNTLRSRLRKFNEQHAEIIEEYNRDPDNFFDVLAQSEKRVGSESSESEWSEEEEKESAEDEEEREGEMEDEEEEDYEVSEQDRSPLSGDTSGWSDSGSQQFSEVEDVDKHNTAMVKWGMKKTEARVESADKQVKVKSKGGKKKEVLEKQPQVTSIVKFAEVLAASEALSEYYKEVKLGSDDNPFEVMLPEVEHMLTSVYLDEKSLKHFIKTIMEKRGKRGTNNTENLKLLQALPYIAKKISHTLYLEVLETLIHLQFDTYAHAYGAMLPGEWVSTYRVASHLVSELVENPGSYLQTDNLSSVAYTINENGEEQVAVSPTATDQTEKVKTSLTILSSIVQKLNDELYKGLLYTDVHNPDYKAMLGYTINMIYLLHRTMLYYTSFEKGMEFAATTAMLILDHCHYKEDGISAKIWDMVRSKVKDEKQLQRFFPNEEKKPSDLVSELVNFVVVYGNQREKVRACLHLAYNRALHGHYYEVRDLFLVSNLHELASETDVSTQILVNRTLAQLGICAFRHGLISEAHSYLMDMCAQSRHKELLAQGLSNVKNMEKTPEQERAEKRRLLPYHMHISIDLLESVDFICALLLESANYAKSPLKSREVISRQFRRMFEMYEKQVFVGPPESNREVILVAFKHLQEGDWKKCYEAILSLNTWSIMPDEEKVKQKVKELVKVEGLRTYIFKYVNLYDAFSVEQLASMFSLDENAVRSVISKMIVNGEVHGSWDVTSTCCMINHSEPTELQKLAVKLAENLSTAVEQNELTLNMKNSKFALAQDRRFQQRDARFSYGARNEDGRMSTFNFNRNKKFVQSRQPRPFQIPTR